MSNNKNKIYLNDDKLFLENFKTHRKFLEILFMIHLYGNTFIFLKSKFKNIENLLENKKQFFTIFAGVWFLSNFNDDILYCLFKNKKEDSIFKQFIGFEAKLFNKIKNFNFSNNLINYENNKNSINSFSEETKEEIQKLLDNKKNNEIRNELKGVIKYNKEDVLEENEFNSDYKIPKTSDKNKNNIFVGDSDKKNMKNTVDISLLDNIYELFRELENLEKNYKNKLKELSNLDIYYLEKYSEIEKLKIQKKQIENRIIKLKEEETRNKQNRINLL